LRHWRLWLLFSAVLGLAGTWAYWNFDVRMRPHNITHSPLEITQALERAGWVSPHLPGPTLYMISFRDCSDCIRFEREVFPRLLAAGVDTRVIVVARADSHGTPHSTPAERTTVAELWANRSWPLYERWTAAPSATWTAPGLIPADGDTTRTLVVQGGRDLVQTLTPLLAENGISFAYPLLVWRTPDGALHGCACESPLTYGHVMAELGAQG